MYQAKNITVRAGSLWNSMHKLSCCTVEQYMPFHDWLLRMSNEIGNLSR